MAAQSFADALTQLGSLNPLGRTNVNIGGGPGGAGFLPNPSGPGATGGGSSGGPSLTGVVNLGGALGGAAQAAATLGPAGAGLGFLAGLFGGGTSVGSQLIRFVLLIIGLICIIGAIYLYKDTNTLIGGVVKKGRDALEVAGALG